MADPTPKPPVAGAKPPVAGAKPPGVGMAPKPAVATSPFADKKAIVYVIEQNDVVRPALKGVFKEMGFADVRVAATIKDAFTLMEQENHQPDWIITTLMANEPANAIHLLTLTLLDPRYRKTCVSLIVEKPDIWAIQNGFEMGLFSWHWRKDTKDDWKKEFQKLLTNHASNGYDACMTSAHYLGEHYLAQQDYDSLLGLKDALIQSYPDRGELFLKKAEVLFLMGESRLARRALTHAVFVCPKIEKQAKEMAETLGAEEEEGAEEAESFASAFDFNTCLIVDNDSTVTKMFTEILTEFGVRNIQCFGDGESAWEWLKTNSKPELVIQEWRVPKLSGLALLQRIRVTGMRTLPVMVYSSVLDASDKILVKEMGVSKVLDKPRDRPELKEVLKALICQQQYPSEPEVIERLIRQYLAAEENDKAYALKDRYLFDKKVPLSKRQGIEAEFAFLEGDLERAKLLASKAFDKTGESIFVLNLLGKISLKLDRVEDAVKCFERAHSLSSNNIERLCALAEAKIELGNLDKANESINKATQVDNGSAKVQETAAKVAIVSGDTAKAKTILSSMENLSDVVRFMNNKAVSLAVKGETQKSVELYRKAIESLPDSRADVRAVVLYNLGLSFVRQNALPDADATFTEAASLNESGVQMKVLALQKKVQAAIQSGKPLVMKAAAAVDATKPADKGPEISKTVTYEKVAQDLRLDKIPEIKDVRKGDLRCHSVIPFTELDEIVLGHLQHLPKLLFKPRPLTEEETAAAAAAKTAAAAAAAAAPAGKPGDATTVVKAPLAKPA